jgi:hypothetical protein
MACLNKKPVYPIIDKPHMVSLLTDLLIVDGSMYSVSNVPDSMYKYGNGKYQLLFKKHHTDSAQFNKSFKYYTTNEAELLLIMDKVQDNLKNKGDSINKIQAKENAIPKK